MERWIGCARAFGGGWRRRGSGRGGKKGKKEKRMILVSSEMRHHRVPRRRISPRRPPLRHSRRQGRLANRNLQCPFRLKLTTLARMRAVLLGPWRMAPIMMVAMKILTAITTTFSSNFGIAWSCSSWRGDTAPSTSAGSILRRQILRTKSHHPTSRLPVYQRIGDGEVAVPAGGASFTPWRRRAAHPKSLPWPSGCTPVRFPSRTSGATSPFTSPPGAGPGAASPRPAPRRLVRSPAAITQAEAGRWILPPAKRGGLRSPSQAPLLSCRPSWPTAPTSPAFPTDGADFR
mmetsp:Transcript_40770/g.122820  ORF Transcript_40770/g.122820 Transcript_40770/m.122820 type:complete len:289 (-) Transcript_40770:723-1589(-)